MKPLAEWLDLIQGKSLDEFVQEHNSPVLIGLGIIAGELQKNPAKAAGTMFLNLGAGPDSSGSDTLVNHVLPIKKVSRETPADGVYVGSGTENDLSIPDSSVSKSHAHLVLTPDGCFFADHGSTNGSFINGTRVDPSRETPLKGGDIVTIGRFSFTYYDSVSFAKLLVVQAMANKRTRSRPPRTPGMASLHTPGGQQRSTLTPGAQSPVPRPTSRYGSSPFTPPPPGRPVAARSTTDGASGQSAGPGSPDLEWRRRAVGRAAGTSQVGQRLEQGRPRVPPGTQRHVATPATPPPQEASVPAKKGPASWFARLLLRISNWLRRLAGD